jgi:hypothetical protein
MGAGKKRKERFLEKHPTCCFCGGVAPATTEDHQPSRQLFFGRQWPEGYAFPACHPCNAATRLDEPIFALIARSNTGNAPLTEQEKQEAEALFQFLRNNRPDIRAEMRLSTARTRREMSDRLGASGVNIDPIDIGAVHIGPLIRSTMSRVGFKLGAALYYHHTGRILPPSGGVLVQWRTIYQDHIGEGFPPKLMQYLTGTPTLIRSTKLLDGQFTYNYAPLAEADAVAFLGTFSFSFQMLMYAHSDVANADADHKDEFIRPFRPDALWTSDKA